MCINCAITGTNANNATDADNATFKITDVKIYVLVVTLSTEGSEKLEKQLSEGFKRPVYWKRKRWLIIK